MSALRLVHAGLGLLLLAAATLKRAEVAARSLADPAAGADGWTLAQSAAEWAWGAWMLAGLYPRPTRRLTGALFGLFAVVAAARGLAGRASCGCFGDLAVSPWATFALDLAAVLALIFVPVRPESDAAAPGWPRALGAATVAAWGLLGGALLPRAILAAPSAWVGGGAREVIPADPAAWVGQRWPLLDRVEAADRLDRGDWLVVLFRRDCAACRAALPAHEATAQRWRAEGSPRRLALVAVPPTIPADLMYLPAPLASVTGQLDPARAWAVATPRAFRLRDGVVAPADPADTPPPKAHDAAAHHHHEADHRAG